MCQTFTVNGEEFRLLELGWRYGYCNTKRAIGRCRYNRSGTFKKIEISRHYLAIEGQNEDTMKDTVLHEIAHAIDCEIRGYSDHSHHWQSVARQVGADPRRTTDEVISPKGRYTLICPKCGKTIQKYRRPSRASSCAPCGNGRYDEKLQLIIQDNKTGENIKPSGKTRRRRNYYNY
jgi:predicted SprT family Zn-dependent metalloprotease